jgi:hypothetical protein
MIVNYNPKKTTVQKLVFHHCTDSKEIIKLSTTKAKEMITSTMSTFDQLSDKGILSASARKSLYEIDNLIRSSMEEYGDLDEETGEFTYKEEHSKLIPIIAIDDVTGILLIQVAILRMRILIN